MHSFGIKLLAIFYCGIGGVLGEIVRGIVLGKAGDWLHERPGFMALAVIGNLAGVSWVVMLYQRRASDQPLRSIDRPLEVLVRGWPVNNRVALLLFSTAWIIGLVLGMLFSV